MLKTQLPPIRPTVPYPKTKGPKTQSVAQSKRAANATTTPSKSPSDKPKTKYGNVPCYDASGNFYHSRAERGVVVALQEAAKRGDCSAPQRGKYRFEYDGVLIGRYTSDANITATRDFKLLTRGGLYEFKAGKTYVIDVKSRPTKTEASQLRFKLMLAFEKIAVLEIYTSPSK